MLKVQVYPSTSHKRIDMFTDAFSHFNSKLLGTRQSALCEFRRSQYLFLHCPLLIWTAAVDPDGQSLIDRRQRPVSADVKALFEGPGQIGFKPSEEPGSTGFAGPLSFDARRVSEFWQPPIPAVSFYTYHTVIFIGTDYFPQPQPPRNESDPSKRDSDPIIQEKLRQASASGFGHPGNHPRCISARTQSLDIISLNFSRSLAGQPFGPMPPSPSGASPSTASGQFFPAHHVHPASIGKGPIADSGLESVTQGEPSSPLAVES